MLGTISAIVLKYWVEFLLGLVVAGGGLFFKRYIKLEKEERERSQDAHLTQLTNRIQEENKLIFESLVKETKEIREKSDEKYNEITTKMAEALTAERDKSKADDAILQAQIHKVSDELNYLKAGLLSMQGKEFRANCRALLKEDHKITLDEWEDIDADHDAYNGLGGNHKGDELFNLVKKKAEKDLT